MIQFEILLSLILLCKNVVRRYSLKIHGVNEVLTMICTGNAVCVASKMTATNKHLMTAGPEGNS